MCLICWWKCFVYCCFNMFLRDLWLQDDPEWADAGSTADKQWTAADTAITATQPQQAEHSCFIKWWSCFAGDCRLSRQTAGSAGMFIAFEAIIIVINHLFGGLNKVLVGREQLLRFDYTLFRVAIQLGKLRIIQ